MLISCHDDILCGIISYNTDILIADTISYVYIEATAIICVTKIRYYVGTKRLPLNWKLLNLLLSLKCNSTSIPLHSSICLHKNVTFVCLRRFDHSVFWPFNVWPFSFLPVTNYRPTTPLFGKIGYEMFHGNFLWVMQGLKMRTKKDFWNMHSQICKSHSIIA